MGRRDPNPTKGYFTPQDLCELSKALDLTMAELGDCGLVEPNSVDESRLRQRLARELLFSARDGAYDLAKTQAALLRSAGPPYVFLTARVTRGSAHLD
jgi:hypothetical protein